MKQVLSVEGTIISLNLSVYQSAMVIKALKSEVIQPLYYQRVSSTCSRCHDKAYSVLSKQTFLQITPLLKKQYYPNWLKQSGIYSRTRTNLSSGLKSRKIGVSLGLVCMASLFKLSPVRLLSIVWYTRALLQTFGYRRVVPLCCLKNQVCTL